jgi:hypothetical protein
VNVRILRNPAALYGCRVAEGETGEVPDNLGRLLVSQGLAECLDPPPEPAPTVRAVPEQPAIAEAVEPEIKPAAVRRYRPKPAVLNVEPRK